MIGLWLVIGGAVGVVNGLIRWWTVARLRPDMEGSALSLIMGGIMVRLALTAAMLVGGLKRGIEPGLFAFAGLWLARTAIVIWIQNVGVPWPPPWAGEKLSTPARRKTS